MSILASDLTNMDAHKFLVEARRRLEAGDLTADQLQLGPKLETIPTETMSMEVHRRLGNGEMTATDFDSDRLIELTNAAIKDGLIEPDDLQIGGDPDFDDEDGVCDMHALDEAAARFRRREYREMLWQLEKALGPAFIGLSDIKPEQFT